MNEDDDSDESCEYFSHDEDYGKASRKEWLRPTGSLLTTLDDVKPSVYNFTLSDVRNLKATNRNQQHGGVKSGDILPSNKAAWGSSGSIPDLLRQHNAQRRPESAKSSRVVPSSSGTRPRPHSAKPSLQPHNKNGIGSKAAFSVLGARCDQSSRPPSGHRQGVKGWVTSAKTENNKYQRKERCDRSRSEGCEGSRCGVSCRCSGPAMSCNVRVNEGVRRAGCGGEEDSGVESIHLSLPSAEDDWEEECVSTARLLELASITAKGKRYLEQTETLNTEGNTLGNISERVAMDAEDGIESLAYDDFHPIDVVGNSSSRYDYLTDTKGHNPKPKPKVHFEESSNVTLSITPRIRGKCIGVDFSSNNNKNVNYDAAITSLTHARKPSPQFTVEKKELSENPATDCLYVRPCTPVSLITLNYGIDASDLENGELKRTGRHVETAVSMLSEPTDKDSQSSKLTRKTISNPEKNYYEMFRNEPSTKNNGNNSVIDVGNMKDNILMTTQTFHLTEGDPRITRTESVISPAPNRRPPSADLYKRARSNSGKQPTDVPKTKSDLNIENQHNIDKTDHQKTPTKYPPRQQVLLRRPRIKSAPVSKPLRGSFQLKLDNMEPKKRPSHSLLSDLDLSDGEDEGESSEVKVEEHTEEIPPNGVTHSQSEQICGTGDSETVPVSLETTHVIMATTPKSEETTPAQTTTKDYCLEKLLKKPAPIKENMKKILKQPSLVKGHYSSYSRSVSAPVSRTVAKTANKTPVKPALCLITKKFDRNQVDVETEEIIECRQLQEKLRQRGVHVDLHTLKRALLPPDGSTYYYEIKAGLPNPWSNGHPRVWLPEEHKKLQQAKRRLARANEQLWLQKLAEEKAANRISENSTVKKKHSTRKSGKKGKRPLRSKSAT